MKVFIYVYVCVCVWRRKENITNTLPVKGCCSWRLKAVPCHLPGVLGAHRLGFVWRTGRYGMVWYTALFHPQGWTTFSCNKHITLHIDYFNASRDKFDIVSFDNCAFLTLLALYGGIDYVNATKHVYVKD